MKSCILSSLVFLLSITCIIPTPIMSMENVLVDEESATAPSTLSLETPGEEIEISDESQPFLPSSPLPLGLTPEYLADLQNPQSKAYIEFTEKMPRYVGTGITAIQGLGCLGMFLYYLNNPGQTSFSKLNQDGLLFGTIATGIAALLRWINWGSYQKNPPSNTFDYFRSYDPLNLKKLQIFEITALTLVMMLPLCIESFGVSTGYFVALIIGTTFLSGVDGYLIKNYFCNKPQNTP